MSTSPGHAITARVDAGSGSVTSELTAAVHDAGGVLTALDVVEAGPHGITVDLTCDTIDADHAERITKALAAVPDASVRKVSDRTFLLHLGGKLEIKSKVALRTRDDLSQAYTPGVARVCLAIAENPEDARRLTIKRNTVAVVTDGSAVLGLGDIGPAASLPVMEGKAILFKEFAGVDAWPVCLDTQDVDEIVSIVKAIAPSYGGINLEDISAPRCFEIERRLRDELDIPVFHDDQHGTAIVVLAALINAVQVVKKSLADVRVVVNGVGAAGHAIIRLLSAQGVGEIVACGREGILTADDASQDEFRRWIFENTNPRRVEGDLRDALRDADVFVGVSAPNVMTADDVATMASDSIVLAMSNPVPEVDPHAAARYAAVVGTGRSDYPNQINNVLAFPGFFAGLLESGMHHINEQSMIAAARAIAACVAPEQLGPSFIVPSVFDPAVAPAVAAAVLAAQQD